MECPLCREYKTRRSWRDSQWNAWKAEANGYRGCRECDPSETWKAHSTTDVSDYNATVATQFGEQSLVLSPKVADMVLDLMVSIKADTRKWMSHFGAVRSREGDPVHYTSPEGVAYFDPGNMIYGLAFKILFPGLAQPHQWNDVTMGDILEILLAMGMRPGASGSLHRLY